MFVLVHGASDSFWAEVERRFVGASMSMDRARMLRFDDRVDADEAWARARELLTFGIEKGVFDLFVHVVSTWDERERPESLPLGFVFLADSVGRTLLSRDANGRRVERVEHERWRGWVDVSRGEPVPPPLMLRPDSVERFVARSPTRPTDAGVLSRDHRTRAKPVDELIASFEQRCVRVLAPARTGKSYVAQRVCDWARQSGYENVFFTRLCRGEPTPSSRWVAREQEEATWIVDGVDEAILHAREEIELLQPLRDLGQAARRLRLVLFQRDEGDRRAFDTKLKSVGFAPDDWYLLPVDEIEAKRILAEHHDSVALEQVIALATKLGVAKKRWLSPPMIQALAAVLERSESPDPREVWRELRQASIAPLPPNVDRARLRMLAERVAVATLLSGSAVDDRLLAAVLEDTTELERRALLRTDLFVSQRDGTFAFRERHVEESLAVGRLENEPVRVLQRLFTDEGALRTEAMGLVDSLREIRPELRRTLETWRDDRDRPLAPDAAGEAIRRLAEKRTRWFGDGRLSRLAHPKVDLVLCEIVTSDPLPPGYRVVFDVASYRDRWERFDAVLLRILRDPSRSWELREEAADFLYRDGPTNISLSDVEAIHAAVTAEPPPEDDDARTDRANVLALLLLARLRLVPSEWEQVAENAPRPDRGRHDGRTTLQATLEETMNLEHAGWVLDRVGSLPKGLRDKATRHVVGQGALDGKWLALVTRERTRNEAVRRALAERWRDDVEARRFGFEHDLWGVPFGSQDADWLLELARSRSEHAPRARIQLFGLARSDEEARRVVEAHFEEAWTRWLEARRREEETWRDGLPASEPESPRPYLLDELRKRRDPETEPTKRFRWLTFLCFSRFAHQRFRGSFTEADRVLRASVLHELRALLKQVVPTPIPSGRLYSTRIADEAAAFVYAVVQSDRLEWLDEATLRRWLPTALFAGHEHLAVCLALCTERHAEVTHEVALEQLRLDVRRREHPVVASSVPMRWLTEALPSLLQEPSNETAEHRARLLELARERDAFPSSALRAWALTEAQGVGPLAAACTRWLLSDPATRSHGIRALEGIPLDANDRLAASLRELAPTFYVERKLFHGWNADHVLALLDRLCRAPVSWEDLPDGIVTDEHRLQALRTTLIAVGVERVGEPALDRLPSERRQDHRWRLNLADSATIAVELEVLLADPARLSVTEVLRILNGATEPRSLDDVFFDVVEALRAIAEDVGEHRFLLLGPKSTPSHEDTVPRVWSPPPHEKALQEYLHARLKSALGRQYGWFREPVEAYGDEPDLVLSYGQHSIPIEVKWSTHPAWRTALETQLVRQYLIDQHRTRGIYVVGFVGTEGAVKRKTSAQEQVRSIREKLETERQRLLAEHPELRLEVIVLPIIRD